MQLLMVAALYAVYSMILGLINSIPFCGGCFWQLSCLFWRQAQNLSNVIRFRAKRVFSGPSHDFGSPIKGPLLSNPTPNIIEFIALTCCRRSIAAVNHHCIYLNIVHFTPSWPSYQISLNLTTFLARYQTKYPTFKNNKKQCSPPPAAPSTPSPA